MITSYSRLFTFLLIAGLSISQIACQTEAKSNNSETNKDSTVVIPVEATTVVTGDIGAFYETTATLEAEQQATVVAKLGGEITEILVEEGDFVKKGQIVARLDDRQYKLEVQRAQSTLKQLENDFERNEELFKKGLISAQAYDDVKYQFENQKASLDLAILNLSYTEIEAPIGGVISQRMIKAGNTIMPNVEIFEITDFDPLLAIVFLPEHELSKIKKGLPVEIKADAVPDQTFNGKVLRVSPTIDPTTGTFKTTVEVKDNTRKLMPGMFTRMRIRYDLHQNVNLVKKDAVMREDELTSVYLIREGKTFKKDVTTGYTENGMIEILDGLNSGDSVVTVGQASVRDSVSVQIIASK